MKVREEDGWLIPCESAHCVKVKFPSDGTVLIGSTENSTVLTFTMSEWKTFIAGVQDGDLDDLI